MFGGIVAAMLALDGILMPAISLPLLLGVVGVGMVYFTILDWLKLWLFNRLQLR